MRLDRKIGFKIHSTQNASMVKTIVLALQFFESILNIKLQDFILPRIIDYDIHI